MRPTAFSISDESFGDSPKSTSYTNESLSALNMNKRDGMNNESSLQKGNQSCGSKITHSK